jgi:hypothetical protein
MERAPSTQWTGGWLGPRAGLDMVSKGKIPSPSGIELQSSDCPAHSLAAIPTELSQLDLTY